MSLTLFVIEDYEPKLSDEALLIEAFAKIHTLSYNKSKGDTQGRKRLRAIAECKYLYHMYDYRSEYSEWDEDEKHEEALSAAGLPEDYVISKELEACAKVILKTQDTRMLRALNSAELALDKLREYFDTIDFTTTNAKGDLIHKPKEVMTSIADLGIYNKKVSDLRKLVKAELKETASLRGDHEAGFDGAI